MAAREPDIAEGRPGFYLEVEIPELAAAERVAIDQLGDRRKAVEVVAVRDPGDPAGPVAATVFVPDRCRVVLPGQGGSLSDRTDGQGPPEESGLWSPAWKRCAWPTVRSLFTDADALLSAPRSGDLVGGLAASRHTAPVRASRRAVERACEGRTPSAFPNGDVVLALADEATMTRLVRNSDAVAELRVAKDTPAMFLAMDGAAPAGVVG